MEGTLKTNLKSRASWKRGFFLLLFAIAYSIAEIVMWAVAFFQFFFLLITGQGNEHLLRLGQGLASYLYQIVRYVTLNSDEKPFPFAPWPGEGGEEVEASQAKAAGGGAGSVAAGAVAGAAAAEVVEEEEGHRVVEGELVEEPEEQPEEKPDADAIKTVGDDRPDAGETESGV